MSLKKTGFVVFPRPPMLPNFLRYPVLKGDDGRFDVGELSRKEAAALWDQWKTAWLDHVDRRRADSASPQRSDT